MAPWGPGVHAIVGSGLYMVLALATLVGAGLNFIGIPPFRLLYYAAAVNGVLAPPFDGDDHVGR